MITSIIIDDEKDAREGLELLIARYFDKELIVLDKCDSVKSGVNAINNFEPEIVFLDIQMPGENGFDLFKHFETINFEVVFTTAYENYAIDAIKKAAFDYLLKPINRIDLMSTIKRFKSKKDNFLRQRQLQILLEGIISGQTSTLNKIALTTQEGSELVSTNNILYCVADGNYCKVKCLNNKEIHLSKTLKKIEGIINDNNFFKVHKSYLVNLNYITKYKKTSNPEITLINGEKIPVAFRRKQELLDLLKDHA